MWANICMAHMGTSREKNATKKKRTDIFQCDSVPRAIHKTVSPPPKLPSLPPSPAARRRGSSADLQRAATGSTPSPCAGSPVMPPGWHGKFKPWEEEGGDLPCSVFSCVAMRERGLGPPPHPPRATKGPDPRSLSLSYKPLLAPCVEQASF